MGTSVCVWVSPSPSYFVRGNRLGSRELIFLVNLLIESRTNHSTLLYEEILPKSGIPPQTHKKTECPSPFRRYNMWIGQSCLLRIRCDRRSTLWSSIHHPLSLTVGSYMDRTRGDGKEEGVRLRVGSKTRCSEELLHVKKRSGPKVPYGSRYAVRPGAG